MSKPAPGSIWSKKVESLADLNRTYIRASQQYLRAFTITDEPRVFPKNKRSLCGVERCAERAVHGTC